MLNKHILHRHTKVEIENYLEIQDEKRNETNEIQVHWIGRYISCPPFTSTIPIDICYNHIPPHPKCLKCNESIERCPMFPPIRFYQSVYFQYVLSSNRDDTPSDCTISSDRTQRQFHFNMKDDECCVVLESGRFAKVEALCEDNFKRCFIGVKYFATYEAFKATFEETKGLSFTGYCDDNNIELNPSDELILTVDVEWVEMTKVVGRTYVFFCNEDEFLQRKMNMGFFRGDSISYSTLKFCQMQWLDDELKILSK